MSLVWWIIFYTVHRKYWSDSTSVESITSAHSYHKSPKNSSHIFQVKTGCVSEEELPTPYYVQIIFILNMIRNGIPAPRSINCPYNLPVSLVCPAINLQVTYILSLNYFIWNLEIQQAWYSNYPVADQGFPTGGGCNPPGKHAHRSLPIFPQNPKNCINWKECWYLGRGHGSRVCIIFSS